MHKLLAQKINSLQKQGVKLKNCEKCPVCEQEETCTWIIVAGARHYYSGFWFQPEAKISPDWHELHCSKTDFFYSRVNLERVFTQALLRGFQGSPIPNVRDPFTVQAHQKGVRLKQDSAYLDEFTQRVLGRTYKGRLDFSQSESVSVFHPFHSDIEFHLAELDYRED